MQFNPEDLEVLPLPAAETIPTSWYTSEACFRFDREQLLAKHWQYVGHESMLRQPGDYIVEEVANKPLIILRNQAGELRGFYNVCRHRGAPVARENGNARVLRCLYHAWTYSLDGELIGTPKFAGVENFNKENCGLDPVAVRSYEGLIFANLAGPEQPFAPYFGGIAENIAPISMKDMKFHHRDTYSVACNWKVYVDNYLEGYHVQPVHPELADVLDVSEYSTTLEEHRVLQHGPFQASDNPYHAPGGEAFYYYIFPNIMLNIVPGRVQINSIIPIDKDRTVTIFDYIYTPRPSDKITKIVEDDRKFSDLVQRQDIEICELVQKGLASGSYTKGRFSVTEEQGVWGFQALLKKAYRTRACP